MPSTIHNVAPFNPFKALLGVLVAIVIALSVGYVYGIYHAATPPAATACTTTTPPKQ